MCNTLSLPIHTPVSLFYFNTVRVTAEQHVYVRARLLQRPSRPHLGHGCDSDLVYWRIHAEHRQCCYARYACADAHSTPMEMM